MKGIARILVLLVFTVVATGALWCVSDARASDEEQYSVQSTDEGMVENASDDADVVYETTGYSDTVSDGDPDSYGDGLGFDGGVLDGLTGVLPSYEDDDDSITDWEELLAYLWSLYYLLQ